MREIKFRAWHLGQKTFVDVRNIAFNSGRILCLNAGGHPKQRIFPEDVELMQYTGLKDKNGKEIYEGDIVWVHSLHKHIIGWNKGSFGWKAEGKFAAGRFISLGSMGEHTYQHTEVIGNCWENPELLKQL